jgi:hypothetical protein
MAGSGGGLCGAACGHLQKMKKSGAVLPGPSLMEKKKQNK